MRPPCHGQNRMHFFQGLFVGPQHRFVDGIDDEGGEPIVVELELENPLAVVIEVTELQLVAEMDASQVLPAESTCFRRPYVCLTTFALSGVRRQRTPIHHL